MKQKSFISKLNYDPEFIIKFNPSKSVLNLKNRYNNLGPRIQINPTKRYYGLEIEKTIYSSPKIFIMDNYNKFRHDHINNLRKKLPKIKLKNLTDENKNLIISKNYLKMKKINFDKYQNNNTSQIEIKTLNNNQSKSKTRNLKQLFLNFPYIKPTKNIFNGLIYLKKKIKITPKIYRTFN